MRILHVVYECEPPRHRGGVQKMVYELATAQAALGHDVVIGTLANFGPPHDTIEGRLTIRRFAFVPGLRGSYSRRLGSILRREKVRFDVVHTHNSFSPLNLTALRLARRWSVPLFVHSHGALDPLLVGGHSFQVVRKRAYIRFVENRVLRAASAVFALTEQEASWVRGSNGNLEVAVVPNGIETPGVATDEEVTAFKVRLGLVDSPVLLYVGRIVPKKNLALIFEAVARLRYEFPSLVLVIGGDRTENPTYVSELDAMARSMCLEYNIRWADFLDESDKRSAYAVSDVFAHASVSEGMPMAVLEAMSAGMPCVVTPGTMMTDAARMGALLERTGVEEFTAAVAGLLSSELQRRSLGSSANELITRRHAWSGIAEEICRIYQAGHPDPESGSGVSRGQTR